MPIKRASKTPSISQLFESKSNIKKSLTATRVLRKFQPNFTYMKCPKHLVRRSIQAAVYYTLNFKYHFFSSLLVFVYYRGSMRLLVALYYIADISSVLPDLNFPFFSSKPLTAYFSWVFFIYL